MGRFYSIKKSCRLCHSLDLCEVLNLKATPPANALVSTDRRKQKKFPLALNMCKQCGHVQLSIVMDPNLLFYNYVYVTGTSSNFVQHFENYAKDVKKVAKMREGDLVLDIASNDGTLLSFFKQMGFSILGVDPAKKISEHASSKGIPTLNEFFSYGLSKKIKKAHGSAKLITANNVMAHIDDLDEVVRGVKNLLSSDGIFVFEVYYLLDIYQRRLFDTIYHEHLDYHTLEPLVNFFHGHKMKITDVKSIDTHGGSLRIFVEHDDGSNVISKNVLQFLEKEKQANLSDPLAYANMSMHIANHAIEAKKFLRKLQVERYTIWGYGAPAKSTTLLHAFGLDKNDIHCIVDDSPWKQGLFSPGLHIPIVSWNELMTSKPDYIIILAWNFEASIIDKCRERINFSTKFITIFPNLRIIDL